MTGVDLSRELRKRGFSADELARLSATGKLLHVRRGAYASPTEDDDVRAAHRRLIEATVRQSSPAVVVSHASAALLHDLPVRPEMLDRVDLSRDRAGGGRVRRWVRLHGVPVEETETVELGGLQVTNLARTVLDLACTLPLEQAVPIGDAALRAGCKREELSLAVSDGGRRHGIGAARRAVALLDPRSESPGESESRVVLAQHGFPAPTPQLEVRDRDGRFVGRCDFGWPELQTLGEFDGRVKYGRTLKPDGDLEDVLWQEKLREDALRDLGWEVVRWTWWDLHQPAEWLARLERAFARARRLG